MTIIKKYFEKNIRRILCFTLIKMDINTWKSEFAYNIQNEPKREKIDIGVYFDYVMFTKNSILHNEEFPSVIILRDNKILEVVYYKNGKLHLDPYDGTDKPTILSYYSKGNIEYIKYYIDGKLHRNPINGIDQPAYIRFHKNGNKEIEKYYIDGKRYRNHNNGVKQPVVIEYDENGNVLKEKYY